MEYKGYLGKVELDEEEGLFHGEVINTRDVITFQGRSVKELKKALAASIEDYLAFCAQRGEPPEKPYSGQFVTRISPELHRRVSLAAAAAGISLNAFVAHLLESAIEKQQPRSRSRISKPGKRPKSTPGSKPRNL
jgi:predicted HicB family RNase H-like nuclease